MNESCTSSSVDSAAIKKSPKWLKLRSDFDLNVSRMINPSSKIFWKFSALFFFFLSLCFICFLPFSVFPSPPLLFSYPNPTFWRLLYQTRVAKPSSQWFIWKLGFCGILGPLDGFDFRNFLLKINGWGAPLYWGAWMDKTEWKWDQICCYNFLLVLVSASYEGGRKMCACKFFFFFLQNLIWFFFLFPFPFFPFYFSKNKLR